MTADRIPEPGNGCPHAAAALLGAWAVDACSEAEADAVMEHLSTCQVCSLEAVRLRRAARALAARKPPPEALRSRVLARARAGRAPAPAVPPYAAPYAAQVSALDALLAELDDRDWSREILPEYGWSAQDLVAHLAATDGLLAARIGLAVELPEAGPEDIDARTAALIAHHRGLAPGQTRTAWRDQATSICTALSAAEAEGRGLARQRIEVPWPMSIRSVVVARAFETWIHTTDIAAAVGRPLPPPLPEHVHPMADQGVRSLPLGLTLRGARPAADVARVVLGGPGGGDWTLRLDPAAGRADGSEVPDVTLTLDVMEFCFLAGGRRDPRTVPARIEGDESAGRDLLAAAPAFTGP